MNTSPNPFIVVGVDGSERSIHALEWAVRHARLLGAEVHVVGAWEVPLSIFVTPTYEENDYQRDARKAFNLAVSRALADLGDEAAAVTIVSRLVQDRPSRALTEAAEGAISLVVGSHGFDRSFPGMHLGSTASYCVHHAPCPVVVVRDQES